MTQQPGAAAPWWKTGIVYQIYVRSFADASGDGIGDLPGIIDRLDYLNGTPDSLGVDAIWLTPFYSSPNVDFGYDVADYRSVAPEHGTLADFDRLIAEAHRRNIRVILDFVPNHTSDRHPWFVESRTSRASAKRDWYVWADGKSGREPNNWTAAPGGKAWTLDPATGQYFYHAFFDCQPDLNWRNAEVRAAVMDDMRFWLDRGADGFRLDLINYLIEDPALRDNPRSLKGWYLATFQAPLFTRDQPETHAIVREMRAMIDSYPGRMMVGETVSYPWEDSPAAEYTSDAELHLAFNMAFYGGTRFAASSFRPVVDRFEARVPADGWPALVLSNHDVPRHVGRYAGAFLLYGERRDAVARAKVCAALLLTLRGTPFLYYGEELGMTNRPLPRRVIQDPLGKKWWPLYQGRDASRTPMLWSPGKGAGFTSGTPWLPIDPDADRLCVQSAARDPDSLFSFYRRLIALRRATPALTVGDYAPVETGAPDVYAYRRRAGTQSVFVALNFSPRPARLVGVPDGRLLLSSDPARTASSAPAALGGYEVLVRQE
jgi:alpha-glucosidase